MLDFYSKWIKILISSLFVEQHLQYVYNVLIYSDKSFCAGALGAVYTYIQSAQYMQGALGAVYTYIQPAQYMQGVLGAVYTYIQPAQYMQGLLGVVNTYI